MTLSYTLDKMDAGDWDQVRAIYLDGIATGDATFEQNAPSWEQWDADHLTVCRLVARSGAAVIGWTALSAVSGRCVYAGVAEVSVYVGRMWRGQRVGSALLSGLVSASEARGIWTLQAGIFPENGASLRLHAQHGFREVGRRERIGQRNNVWRDVVLLERRSQVVSV